MVINTHVSIIVYIGGRGKPIVRTALTVNIQHNGAGWGFFCGTSTLWWEIHLHFTSEMEIRPTRAYGIGKWLQRFSSVVLQEVCSRRGGSVKGKHCNEYINCTICLTCVWHDWRWHNSDTAGKESSGKYPCYCLVTTATKTNTRSVNLIFATKIIVNN